ncbi:hypothetical protein, partial [Vibrio sp. V17_P4S1T151]
IDTRFIEFIREESEIINSSNRECGQDDKQKIQILTARGKLHQNINVRIPVLFSAIEDLNKKNDKELYICEFSEDGESYILNKHDKNPSEISYATSLMFKTKK